MSWMQGPTRRIVVALFIQTKQTRYPWTFFSKIFVALIETIRRTDSKGIIQLCLTSGLEFNTVVQRTTVGSTQGRFLLLFFFSSVFALSCIPSTSARTGR
jgi:hypothetical protein